MKRQKTENPNERREFRKWILKAFEVRKGELLSKQFIEQFVKTNIGVADKSCLKLVLQDLLDSGDVIKIDGSYILRQE
ncbi:hypothetical protein AVEN_187481-1 [Araneus ventricosus]|uniref:Uncharacterized protein n=1 Tax=Araneus ventricosus TaxID=182803 RepID=A0A4Y2BSD2_ARAVE|nr:hypothetical protein AVEN_187481-1 [Araneus ventricosus]